ncbi:uncharacterized protein (TIGR02186 family) [Xanthobacter sp. SG618]|uniref:TIGR02186 family protein n=1 Tax=Xanthobacter sp. SG618 TaxID=2587121 RepID=UPI00145DCD65|nr:TIGR02186 family protein [Xanthobacter sp. SG618]NMN60657.1 uncharacterized protein (TIGR02186 family) [Xanthobacter sp. SG618]
MSPIRNCVGAGPAWLLRFVLLTLALLVSLVTGPARADRLVLSVSQQTVSISSSFSGAELVLFGVAEATDGAPIDDAPDVVVTVRGPAEDFTTWRKAQVLGLWVNTDSRTFIGVPAFLTVLSNRPTDEMASLAILRREQIGLARNIFVQRVSGDFADVVPSDPFRAAFLRLQSAHGLYEENPKGVTFLAPRVFRAEVRIPGAAPIGAYQIEVKLLRNGLISATEQATFEVRKIGFEQRVAEFALNDALLYGLAVALGSLIVGFIANILFRKE